MCSLVTGVQTCALPISSDFLLARMGMPAFRILFQVMIFAALLESGAGAVHAINERISGAVESRGRAPLGTGARALIGTAILTVCMFVAGAVGLVDLIASGYRALAWLFLALYLAPLLTIGAWRLLRHPPPAAERSVGKEWVSTCRSRW